MELDGSFRRLVTYVVIFAVSVAVLLLVAKYATSSFYVLPDGTGVAFLIFTAILAVIGIVRESYILCATFVGRMDWNTSPPVYFMTFSILFAFTAFGLFRSLAQGVPEKLPFIMLLGNAILNLVILSDSARTIWEGKKD